MSDSKREATKNPRPKIKAMGKRVVLGEGFSTGLWSGELWSDTTCKQRQHVMWTRVKNMHIRLIAEILPEPRLLASKGKRRD